jgi:membrane protein DedA with SNARE-associated domain
MVDLLNSLVEWMSALPPSLMYLTILVIAYGENVVPPIPGDMIVVFGGYLAGITTLNIWVVIVLSTLGGAAGFMTMFSLGNRLGEAIMDPHKYRWLPKDQILVGRKWLQRWGFGLIIANRFLSGTRSVISLVAGMAHMDAKKVLICSTISAAVWTFIIAWGGYLVGDNWEVVGEYLAAYGRIMLWAVLIFVAGYVGWRFFRRHETKMHSSAAGSGLVDAGNEDGLTEDGGARDV